MELKHWLIKEIKHRRFELNIKLLDACVTWFLENCSKDTRQEHHIWDEIYWLCLLSIFQRSLLSLSFHNRFSFQRHFTPPLCSEPLRLSSASFFHVDHRSSIFRRVLGAPVDDVAFRWQKSIWVVGSVTWEAESVEWCGLWAKMFRWRSEKHKVKAVFKLHFHVTQVAKLGFISQWKYFVD